MNSQHNKYTRFLSLGKYTDRPLFNKTCKRAHSADLPHDLPHKLTPESRTEESQIPVIVRVQVISSGLPNPQSIKKNMRQAQLHAHCHYKAEHSSCYVKGDKGAGDLRGCCKAICPPYNLLSPGPLLAKTRLFQLLHRERTKEVRTFPQGLQNTSSFPPHTQAQAPGQNLCTYRPPQ